MSKTDHDEEPSGQKARTNLNAESSEDEDYKRALEMSLNEPKVQLSAQVIESDDEDFREALRRSLLETSASDIDSSNQPDLSKSVVDLTKTPTQPAAVPLDSSAIDLTETPTPSLP